MSYLWNEFNIKTFPAETIVFRDDIYMADLSTLENAPIDKNYDLPVHIIYIGEITGKNRLNIDVLVKNQKVFFSADIKIKKPAFLNIFIKNAGKNSEIYGQVMITNENEFEYDCTAHHTEKNTGIFVKTKLFGRENSKSKLSGTAIIDNGCDGCESDIGFSALAEQNAKIEFMPSQRISAEPISAEHSASIYRPNDAQILFLRQAGLSGEEVNNAMIEAFKNDF